MEQTELQPQARHRIVPATLVAAMVPQWIERNAKGTFHHSQKQYYTTDELDDKARKSCQAGVTMLGLDEILAKVKHYVENGLGEGADPIVMVLAPTVGMKSLKKTRAGLDKEVSMGYEEVTIKVYELPDVETQTMVCLTAEGIELPERTRPMSPKEKHEFVGVFLHRPDEALRHAK